MSSSSIFASFITKVVEMPGAPEHTVTIRKLAPKHLSAAAKASQLESIAAFKEIGGAAFVKELQSMGGDEAVSRARSKDPLIGYDRLTLLEHGIKSWTFEEPLSREFFEDNLDDDTLTTLAREVLQLAKPALFVAEPEEARKNG